MFESARVEAEAKLRANIDKSHNRVYWHCRNCKKTEESLVSVKKTDNQCGCGYWMEWSYRPFAYSAA